MKTIHKISMSLLIAALSLLTSCEISTGEGEDGYGYGAVDYRLGQTGPGGGKIFYVNPKGFTVQGHPSFGESYTAYYLEAAPVDQGTSLFWGSMPSVLTAWVIGTGRKNTALILAQYANAPAAKECRDYRGGGLDDWFLPNQDELNVLHDNSSYVDNLNAIDYYWSSTDFIYDDMYAYARKSSGGSSLRKDDTHRVRAIRAF